MYQTQVADADTDAADLPAVAFVAHLGQHRIIELEPGLVGDVRDDETHRTDVEPTPGEERRKHDTDDRADDQERHPFRGAVGHRAEQRRRDEDDRHRDRADDAPLEVGFVGAGVAADQDGEVE